MNPFDLSGKHILVTGASSGIGKATAILCSELGARMTINGRNNSRLEETLSSLSGEGHRMFCLDLSDNEKVIKMATEIEKLDGIAFCAGTQVTCTAKNIEESVIDILFQNNFDSLVLLVSAILSKKKLNKGASLAFVSSLTALHCAQMGNALYSATKGAILSYSKVLALELSCRKIRVNTVSPGMVRTPLLEKIDITPEQLFEDEKKYPFGYGCPDDVASTIAFLLSDGAKWITGTDMILDGGFRLQ